MFTALLLLLLGGVHLQARGVHAAPLFQISAAEHRTVQSWAPPLMPVPRAMELREGSLRVDGTFRIGFTRTPGPILERARKRWIALLAARTGIPLRSDGGGAPTLTIDCADPADHPLQLGDAEAYRLEVTPTGARLTTANVGGALRGMQTFLQLVAPDATSFAAPAVHIDDAPRFPWRGLLIDVTSHFMPVPVIERTLDAMEAVKLNVFHWHITDDQGFRVESKIFPKLHQLGSDGDYYTQDDIRHIVAYARDRGIRVIPELDMPGHCATWLIGYPELASAPGPYSIIHTFGVYDPTLDPTREEIYTFIDKLIGEFTTLFPDAYFHVGGDEVTGKHWKNNARIQEFVKRKGLRDSAGLQTYFNQRVAKLVAKHGRKMMGWDEVLHPDLPKDTLVESWRDHESMAAAAKRGYRTLLAYGYYLDHLDLAGTYYSVDPLGGPAKGLDPEAAARVLGGEACMWTEFISPETIDSRIWPKSAAIAERLWSPAITNDVGDMYARLYRISNWLDATGVRHNLNYGPMLRRLAPAAPLDAVRTLVDTLDPLGIEGRETTQTYSQSTALNRVVDAARGDSLRVRRLERQVAQWLAAPDGESEAKIRETLTMWRDNDGRLAGAFGLSFLLAEAAPLSRDLGATAKLGLEALDFLKARTAPPTSWTREAAEALKRMEAPRVEVVLAAVRPVRALVKAASALPGDTPAR
jgi:hexosaminidase